ncbi:putative GRX1-glutaredoxin [Exidia glandulosa HHB12029]|uniref:glutathione peroxidase n=1 Tax=Exidia glandulosa HHB12029 TaxID=1314781 RepID=A0A165B6Y9_EXIGL|nr:putative GRX1-glutaredoxin [Exidia glandulosa HHB12029]KZV99222.1 putative GRX1-glutaredoxin [Exidia glandulosa HHB12029]
MTRSITLVQCARLVPLIRQRTLRSSSATFFTLGASSSKSEMSVRTEVEDIIAKNDIAVFAKSWCPYCRKARGILDSVNTEGKTVKIVDLDKMDEGSAYQEYLNKKTGQRTVPNIFIHQQHIGGCDDLSAQKDEGKLQALIDAK